MASMALIREWTPSPNYSGGATKRLLVLHTMEGFSGPNGAYDCAKYFQGNVGASSQVCIDNFHPGKIWECVSRGNGAWTQCNFNTVSVSCEQAGFASWSRDYWLNYQDTLLKTTAAWLAEESKKLGIPLVALTASQAQGGSWGVTQHSYLGSTGCGHSDCGSGYPIDKVIEWAKGGSSPAPETEYEMTPAVVFDSQNRPHRFRVNDERQIKYRAPTSNNWVIIDPAVRVKKGVGAGIDTSDRIQVIYDNDGGDTCAYELKPGQSWTWQKLGW